MSDKADGKLREGRGDELRLLAESIAQKNQKGGSIDEMSLESRRHTITYDRARGNA